jgi:phosphatidylglycerol:prolipoprotein diacylglycerol transferase
MSLALQFPDFDPAAVTIPALHLGSLVLGPFPIRWYALAYIAGILLGWRYAVALVRNPKLWGARGPTATPAQIDDLILWITFGVILGGRIGYILFYMLVNDQQRASLFADPLQVFEIWQGGMSFHGALIGVTAALVAFSRTNRIDLWLLGDLVAPCEPIGQFFGRVANFINGELWGRALGAADRSAVGDGVLQPTHPRGQQRRMSRRPARPGRCRHGPKRAAPSQPAL